MNDMTETVATLPGSGHADPREDWDADVVVSKSGSPCMMLAYFLANN